MEGKKYNIENYNCSIYNCSICRHCVGKLYSKKDTKIIKGVGNIYAKNLIVLPVYDNRRNSKININKQLNLLEKLYREAYHKELLENCYVTWGVRCKAYEVKEYAILDCIVILLNLIAHHRYSVIVSSGSWLEEKLNNYCKRYDIEHKTIININSVLLNLVFEDTYKQSLLKLNLL